jgi:hypothetical protein
MPIQGGTNEVKVINTAFLYDQTIVDYYAGLDFANIKMAAVFPDFS